MYTRDEFYRACELALECKKMTVALLQRRMKISYTKTEQIICDMEKHGLVSKYENKPRDVLFESMDEITWEND